MTTGSKAHNLQIQVQKNAPNTSVAKEARTKPTTVAHVEFTVSSNATPDQVRTAFKRSHEPIKQQKACFKVCLLRELDEQAIICVVDLLLTDAQEVL